VSPSVANPEVKRPVPPPGGPPSATIRRGAWETYDKSILSDFVLARIKKQGYW
jgi:hypothetical protein